MTSIFVATMHGKWMPTRFGWERERVIEHLRRDRLFGGASWAEGLRVDTNYNNCVKDFLQSSASHLLMLNDDMGYPDSLGYRMLETQASIACGLYFNRDGDWAGLPQWYEHVRSGVDEWGQPRQEFAPMVRQTLAAMEHGRPIEIDASGTGCLLIDRQVLVAMGGPWFQSGGGTNGDLLFFLKAKREGFSVWGNPNVRCDHYTMSSVNAAQFHAMERTGVFDGLPLEETARR